MKININTCFSNKNTYQYNSINSSKHSTVKATNYTTSELQTTPLYYGNISFGMNASEKFLLEQSDRLICAYSGRDMISPKLYNKILEKIQKKPNIESAVRYLFQYQKNYMHSIESEIFDLFNDKNTLKQFGDKTFTDVLLAEKPEAIKRLRQKQVLILENTDKLINKMDAPVADLVRAIRNDAMLKIANDTFVRKSPLEMLRHIKTSGKDQKLLQLIYDRWYKLPSSSTDIDAFIVKYSNRTHEQIAKRLLSPAVATIEHVIPKSKGGDSDLGNYLLVSAAYNNERSAEQLHRYIELHEYLDIPLHIQKYINLVIREVNDKKSPFHEYAWYPVTVARAIAKETQNLVTPVVQGINAPIKEINQKDVYVKKMCEKYVVNSTGKKYN